MFCILFHFDKEGIPFFPLPLHLPHTSILEHSFDIKKCHAILDDSKHPLPFPILSQCTDACSVQVLPTVIHIILTSCDTDVREGEEMLALIVKCIVIDDE
jgi:hypothetical protein